MSRQCTKFCGLCGSFLWVLVRPNIVDLNTSKFAFSDAFRVVVRVWLVCGLYLVSFLAAVTKMSGISLDVSVLKPSQNILTSLRFLSF